MLAKMPSTVENTLLIVLDVLDGVRMASCAFSAASCVCRSASAAPVKLPLLIAVVTSPIAAVSAAMAAAPAADWLAVHAARAMAGVVPSRARRVMIRGLVLGVAVPAPAAAPRHARAAGPGS